MAACSSVCCAPMCACRIRRWATSTRRWQRMPSAWRACANLAERYGAEKIVAAMAALQDYSETRMRAAIRAVPDGVYRGEDAVDDDGDSDAPLPVCATVTIRGDSVAVDFTGTAPQVRRHLNSPFASTVSAALSCVKAVLTSPDIPFNAGAARPVTITAPEGSLLNPRRPAPVRARMEACFRAWNATMKALAQAVPEQVIACGFDTTTVGVLSHLEPHGWSVYLEIYGGGYGASVAADGCDAVDGPLSNCSNTPVEALDQDFGFFRVLEYSLRPDSAGAGEFRGGLGFLRRFEIIADDVKLALYSDRFRRTARWRVWRRARYHRLLRNTPWRPDDAPAIEGRSDAAAGRYRDARRRGWRRLWRSGTTRGGSYRRRCSGWLCDHVTDR